MNEDWSVENQIAKMWNPLKSLKKIENFKTKKKMIEENTNPNFDLILQWAEAKNGGERNGRWQTKRPKFYVWCNCILLPLEYRYCKNILPCQTINKKL